MLQRCKKCGGILRVDCIDGKSIFICEKCEECFPVKPVEDCEHPVKSLSFGVNNLCYCTACGNLMAYEKIEGKNG